MRRRSQSRFFSSFFFSFGFLPPRPLFGITLSSLSRKKTLRERERSRDDDDDDDPRRTRKPLPRCSSSYSSSGVIARRSFVRRTLLLKAPRMDDVSSIGVVSRGMNLRQSKNKRLGPKRRVVKDVRRKERERERERERENERQKKTRAKLGVSVVAHHDDITQTNKQSSAFYY